MLQNSRIVCVLPAYNAARTLSETLKRVPADLVDQYVLVDDASKDATVQLARELAHHYPLDVVVHQRNRGYGANQKSCYKRALELNADIVVMLHPDNQYDGALLPALIQSLVKGSSDIALGSRFLEDHARAGGMPLYKYAANKLLTAFENRLLGLTLSEYHTGYRAYTRATLERIPWQTMSDDFIFDNQFLVAAHLGGLRIHEIAIPTRYFPEASSISFLRSLRYGAGVLECSMRGYFQLRSRSNR